MEFIKKYGGLIIFILMVPFIYCWSNNWLYYYFDVLAKCSPAIAGACAYYMWSQNRELHIKKLEYKQDYYRKIIDKRIIAYNDAELFLSEFKIVNLNPNKRCRKFFIDIANCDIGKDCRSKYENNKLELISKNSFWFSKKLLFLLAELINEVNDISNSNDILSKAIETDQKIQKYLGQIEEIIAADFVKLYDVDDFLEGNK